VLDAHGFYTGTGAKPPGVNKKAAYNYRKGVDAITNSKEVGYDGLCLLVEVAACWRLCLDPLAQTCALNPLG
jgi:hypothetical protein